MENHSERFKFLYDIPSLPKSLNEEDLKKAFPENDAEACLTALKYENLSAEEFDSHWKACAKYRLNDINIMPTCAEVFQKWTFYKKPYGYRLVDLDYEIAFGNGELLLNNWEKSFPNIVAFLQKDGHIKDTAAKALLEKSVKDSCGENGKYAFARGSGGTETPPSSNLRRRITEVEVLFSIPGAVCLRRICFMTYFLLATFSILCSWFRHGILTSAHAHDYTSIQL
ncbi:hypothetical protein JTB14_005631 [Gonioctena quinquepunctata]|nr:hypothetical protein JTB14_005631 [Gonioctena quinquepunctata]